ncbi:SubName: Full=Uncharacterized protein {ECO:0000313/EMBL:CCA71510.1} [Serendipita indica DSM 11827]|nr:SubName: Full=Uncharacterized protein {ECO:0000313/EMBL:CCA71510.1} [Serendipita indica DSM 11827]
MLPVPPQPTPSSASATTPNGGATATNESVDLFAALFTEQDSSLNTTSTPLLLQNQSSTTNSDIDWFATDSALPLTTSSDILLENAAQGINNSSLPEPDQFEEDLERALAGIEPDQLSYINALQPAPDFAQQQYLLHRTAAAGPASHHSFVQQLQQQQPQQLSNQQANSLGVGTPLANNANTFNTSIAPAASFANQFGFGSFTSFGGAFNSHFSGAQSAYAGFPPTSLSHPGPLSALTASSESAYGAEDNISESYYNPYSPQGSLVNAPNSANARFIANNPALFQALENFSNELAAFGLSDATNLGSNHLATIDAVVPSQTTRSIQPSSVSLDLLMPSSIASGTSYDELSSSPGPNNASERQQESAEREFGSSTGLVGSFVPVPPQSATDPRKKYQCPSCPRAFARAFNLKTHMATHDPNRLKPHVCHHTGCGRSFSRKHDLGRHLVSIHKDESGLKLTHPDSAAPASAGASAVRSGASTYGVSGHPVPPGRVHHVGKGSLTGINTKVAKDSKGAVTPTSASFMPNIALGSSFIKPEDTKIPPFPEESLTRVTRPAFADSSVQRPGSTYSASGRAGSTYSTKSGVDGGLGVAAPGVSRGWCDTCGQGWVGNRKTCHCNGEVESKIKIKT